jgi:CTP:molybdopterin cytidylyltransferase MocA
MADAPVDFVVLVLGARADEIRAAVDTGDATVVVADDWESGQSASLRAGVAEARSRGADAVVVTLGDQPRISAAAIGRVAAADAVAARATYDGVPAHPVLLRAELFDAVAALGGDTGARGLLKDAAAVPCDGLGSPADVDTHKDLADFGGQA